MCTRHGTLQVPATALVELAQIGQEPMRRRIEVCGLFCDPLAQLIELSVHDDLLPHGSDIPIHHWTERGD